MATPTGRIPRACVDKIQAAIQTGSKTQSLRRFHASGLQYQAKDVGKDPNNQKQGRTHLLEKEGEENNPQSSASKAAHQERQQGDSHSSAIDQKDHNKSKEKAKMEFPEARDPWLGTNDERGDKGF